MQVSVESTSTLGRRVKIAVPAETFEQAFADRLRRLSQQMKLPGFRPGKVPIKMVEARYGGQLLQEVAGDLIQTTLPEAIGAQGLKPAGGTKIRQQSLARGRAFEYTAEFEIFPEIKQLDLAGSAIERPVATITDDDVNRTLDTIRRQRMTWRPVERAAQAGDRTLIDFVGRLDGTEFEGGKGQAQPLVLGSGTFIKELEDGIVGATVGETRRINATFPADYRFAPIAGKTVEFEVSVKEIGEPVLPEIDDELATQLGVTEGGVDKLRADVRGNLEREAAHRGRALLRRNVLEALLKANQFDVPAGLIETEIARLQQLSTAGGQGGSPDPASLQPRARTRVALGLILAEIVRARGLRPDAAKVRARIEEMAADYDAPQKFIEWYYASPERLGEVESLVLEERIVEELLAGAQVQDRALGFQELLSQESGLQ